MPLKAVGQNLMTATRRILTGEHGHARAARRRVCPMTSTSGSSMPIRAAGSAVAVTQRGNWPRTPYARAHRHGLGGPQTSRRLRRRVAPHRRRHRPIDTPGCSPGSSTGSASAAPGPPSTPTYAWQPHSTPPPSTRTSRPIRPVDCPTDVGAPHSGQHDLAGGRSRR